MARIGHSLNCWIILIVGGIRGAAVEYSAKHGGAMSEDVSAPDKHQPSKALEYLKTIRGEVWSLDRAQIQCFAQAAIEALEAAAK